MHSQSNLAFLHQKGKVGYLEEAVGCCQRLVNNPEHRANTQTGTVRVEHQIYQWIAALASQGKERGGRVCV